MKRSDLLNYADLVNQDHNALGRIASALERIAENCPPVDSIRFFTADTDLVPAHTILTVTFVIDWRRWSIKVTELYADSRPGVDYEWIFAGVHYYSNEPSFDFGQKAVEEAYHTITLRITNPTATDYDIHYYVKGWAVSKEA